MSTGTYINSIVTAVPRNNVHGAYIQRAKELLKSARDLALFMKMMKRSGIENRFSVLENPFDPHAPVGGGFYTQPAEPTTQERMTAYERYAPELCSTALAPLMNTELQTRATHLVLTSCTGFYAPGLDVELIDRFKLNPDIERTIVGFMGCEAAINGLKVANYIVRSERNAKVLMINLELCSLHFQVTPGLEQLLCFLLFADGCAASVISSEPKGMEIRSFFSTILPDTRDQMRWDIKDLGFDMYLSARVPGSLRNALRRTQSSLLGDGRVPEIPMWAIHPGGRSILDAVQAGLNLSDSQMNPSRTVLRQYGNMSSPSIMFILREILADKSAVGTGCGMAFGPGLTLESFLFRKGPRE